MSLFVEKIRELEEQPLKEKDQYHDACRRASRIVGIFNFLLEQEALNRINLRGRVVDLGTGSGGGTLAARLFGAKEVFGVDDCLGLGGGLGATEAMPSQTVFNMPGVRFQFEKVQEFINTQPPETFDLITAFRLPPFRFPTPSELCQMAYPLLKPGGQIIMTEGDMISPREEDRLLRKNGQRPVEVVFNGEEKPWWNVEQFRGRLFFMPVLKAAVVREIEQDRRIVFREYTSDNITDKEVFIGTKLAGIL